MKTIFLARYRFVVACTLASIFFLVGTNTAQEARPLGFSVMSAEKEAQMGAREFEKYKSKKTMVRSGREYQAMMRVANRMVKVVNVKNAKWEFVLFKDPTPNAFALPGGKVGVHTGMFNVAQNESQLAAVIGHELAHVTERHSGKRISNAMLGSGIGAVAGAILNKKTGMKGRNAQVITQGAAALQSLSFSRKQELEADRVGTVYMAKAGYDPRSAVDLWKRFAAYKAQKGGSKVPGFMSTHPVDSRRIEELQKAMPQALKYYKSGSTQSSKPSSSSSSNSEEEPVRALRPRFR
ncbi:MAG: M48 family metallopeptidase [Verrucomicrobiota bacterium]